MPDQTGARLHTSLRIIADVAGTIPIMVNRCGAAVPSPMSAPGAHAQMLLVLLDIDDVDYPGAPRGPSGFSADWIAWAVEKAVLRIVGPPSPPLESVVALGVFLRQGTGNVALVLTEPERASVWHDTLGPDTRIVGLHGDVHSGLVH